MSVGSATTDNFFDEQKEKSKVKTEIVINFLNIYLIIISNSKWGKGRDIYYLDLFSGPGVYKDGSHSTPIEVMNMLSNMKNRVAADKVHLVFNDENCNFINSLKENIRNHSYYNSIIHKPVITNKHVCDFDLDPFFCTGSPIFSFIDPWGYKDINTNLIWSLVKPIGSDCILFFNSNRILQDLSKTNHYNDMLDLFGDEYSNALGVQKNRQLSQNKKADLLLEFFIKNLYNKVKLEYSNMSISYKLFALPFTFLKDDSVKTSHQIVFLTKNHKAIIEMKKVMVKKSNNNAKEFLFDNKKIGFLSFFTREDDVNENFRRLITDMLKVGSSLFNKTFTCESLLEYIDRYSMSVSFSVTSYTSDDVKKQIETLDNLGLIELQNIEGKIIRKRITNSREFKFSKKILE